MNPPDNLNFIVRAFRIVNFASYGDDKNSKYRNDLNKRPWRLLNFRNFTIHFLIKLGRTEKTIEKICFVAVVFSLSFPSNTHIDHDAVPHITIQ